MGRDRRPDDAGPPVRRRWGWRFRAGRLLLAGPIVWTLVAGSMVEARAHGGQRVVPMRAVLDSAGSFRIEFSLDVALTPAAAGLDPMAVTHEWLRERTEAELAGIAESGEGYLRECFTFHFADGLVDGAYEFPDLGRLGDPGFASDEPTGHLLVVLEGVLPGAGGAPGDFSLSLSEEAPAAVVTVVVDGRPRRRPIVAVAGESRVIESIRAAEAAGPGSLAESGGEEAVGGERSASVLSEATTVEPFGEDGGFADEGEATGGALIPMFGLGWAHVWPRGGVHVALALVVFLVAPRWSPILASLAALAVGALVGVLAPVVAGGLSGGGWGHAACLGIVAALNIVAPGRPPVGTPGGGGGIAAAAGWLRLVVLAAFGWIHASGMSLMVGGERLPVSSRLAEAAGVEAGHWAVVALAFVLLGWGWGAPWFRTRVAVPGCVALFMAAVAIPMLRGG